MAISEKLKPVVPQPGRPLYESVKEAVSVAIDTGHFRPGEQMPSTKELSKQLSVSLVTAHRALQELVAGGVLDRRQGHGTFVRANHRDAARRCRVGLVFHAEASLADYYHGQVVEGLRQAAKQQLVDLVMMHFDAASRTDCHAFLYLNPRPEELDRFRKQLDRDVPGLVLGARVEDRDCHAIDVDNVELARQAVRHLHQLGHARVGFVGGSEELSNSRDRRQGFIETCGKLGLTALHGDMIESAGWRLSDPEKMALARMLSDGDRPTAIFAAGYYFALDVYEAAQMLDLRIPEDLSVVGVDDPPSATHLSPPLTTLRQPLVQLGHAAVAWIAQRLADRHHPQGQRVLKPELVIRASSAGPRAAAPA